MPNQSGLVAKNPANNTVGHHIHNYSTFDESLSYRLSNTHRFGDYIPTFVMEGVEKDVIHLNSFDKIDSLSLASPFKGSIRKIKESFKVPFMAILPNNWDKIYTQPSNGDDVPTEANCVLTYFSSQCYDLWKSTTDVVSQYGRAMNSAVTHSDICSWVTGFLRCLVLGEYMFSNGSLLHTLGYKYASNWHYIHIPNASYPSDYYKRNYDEWMDSVLTTIFSNVTAFVVVEPVGNNYVTHNFRGLAVNSPDPVNRMSFRALLELFRENPLCNVDYLFYGNGVDDSTFYPIVKNLCSNASTAPMAFNTNFIEFDVIDAPIEPNDITAMAPYHLNISRLLAYQLICSHYYTNSSVDFIYSADIFRQYVFGMESKILPINDASYYFTWNGKKLFYDSLSGKLLNLCLALVSNPATIRTNFISSILLSAYGSGNTAADKLGPLVLWSAIFGYRKSLRYGDYFVSSRPRPLAPINTNVSVSGSSVSVVDITRNIQAQRFANAVMRSRSKVEEYVKSLFGKAPAPDYHNPFFLASHKEIVFGEDVQNTADSQIQNPNSRTANFAGRVSPFTFTFRNDDMHPCIYMQIVSYDTKMSYSRSVDRQFLNLTRYDMFNPDFQYIGDQAVYGVELGYHRENQNIPGIFSYQTRDAEYKQRFDVCSGGFASNALDGWLFTDSHLGSYYYFSLSPDFIRSRNADLDRFFISLTGFSLGTYFHFICITDNNVSAQRAMAVDPQILA